MDNNGPKVGVHLGLTFRINKDSNYEFIRPDITIDNIDVTGNIEEQIERAKEALRKVFKATEDMTDELVMTQMNRNIEAETKAQLSVAIKRIDNEIKNIKVDVNELKTNKSGANKSA